MPDCGWLVGKPQVILPKGCLGGRVMVKQIADPVGRRNASYGKELAHPLFFVPLSPRGC
jgi:hypothetical protein